MTLNSSGDVRQPKISIVVPLFDDEGYVAAAIESCLAQTMSEFEVLCVDDASTDATAAIVQSFAERDSRVRLLRQDTNRSAFQARRMGIYAATAPFVMFLDGDDLLTPDAAEISLQRAQETGADVVGFGVEILTDTGGKPTKMAAALQPKYAELRSSEIVQRLFPQDSPPNGHLWRYLFATSLLKKAYGAFPDEAKYYRANDLPISFLALSHASHYASVPNKLYRYYFRRGTSGHKIAGLSDLAFLASGIESFSAIRDEVQRIAEQVPAHRSLGEYFDAARLHVIANVFGYCVRDTAGDLQRECVQALSRLVGATDLVRAVALGAPKSLHVVAAATATPSQPEKPVERVLLTTRRMDTGGLQTVVAMQASQLIEAGFSVTVAVFEEVKHAIELPHGVRLRVIPHGSRLSQVEYWQALLLSEEIDMVIDHHVMYNENWPWFAISALAVGIPTIGWIHTFSLRPVFEHTDRLSFLQSYAHLFIQLVTLSDVDVAMWKLLGRDRVVHIPNPPSALAQRALSLDSPHRAGAGDLVELAWWGRLDTAVKQVPHLIRVAKYLHDREVPFRLTIVGPDSRTLSAAQVRDDAKRHGVSEYVEIIGDSSVDQLLDILNRTHLLISTSAIEGYQLTILEAQAAGIPVVMYELPWLTLAASNPGLISTPLNDPALLAGEIVRLAAAPDVYSELSAAARTYARNVISIDIVPMLRGLLDGDVEDDISPVATLEHARILLEASIRFAQKNTGGDEYSGGKNGHLDSSKLAQALQAVTVDRNSLERQVRLVREGWSFRLGRVVTFAPRKLRDIIHPAGRTSSAKVAGSRTSPSSKGSASIPRSAINQERALRVVTDERNKLKRELRQIKEGWSFRVGRTITFVPRKIRDMVRPAAQSAYSTKPAFGSGSPKATSATATKRIDAATRDASIPNPLRVPRAEHPTPRVDSPDVSIVIPVFNSAAWIEDCVYSVLSQSNVDVEVICIDDGSTDSTPAVLESIARQEPRVTVIRQENSGQSVGRNRGLAEANGRYIIYLDSDDFWTEDCLWKLVARADQEKLDVLLFDCAAFLDGDVAAATWQRYSKYYQRKQAYDQVASGVELMVRMRERKDYRPHVGLYMTRTQHLREHAITFIPGIVHQDNPYTFELLLTAKRASHERSEVYARRIRPGSTITTLTSQRSARGYFLSYVDMVNNLRESPVERGSSKIVYGIVDSVYEGARKQFGLLDATVLEELRPEESDGWATEVWNALCQDRDLLVADVLKGSDLPS